MSNYLTYAGSAARGAGDLSIFADGKDRRVGCHGGAYHVPAELQAAFEQCMAGEISRGELALMAPLAETAPAEEPAAEPLADGQINLEQAQGIGQEYGVSREQAGAIVKSIGRKVNREWQVNEAEFRAACAPAKPE